MRNQEKEIWGKVLKRSRRNFYISLLAAGLSVVWWFVTPGWMPICFLGLNAFTMFLNVKAENKAMKQLGK